MPARTETESIIVIGVEKLYLGKRFLERDLRIGTVRAATHVDIDDAVFASVQIVRHAERRRDLDRPGRGRKTVWPLKNSNETCSV